MRNFWTGFAIAAVVAIVAVFLAKPGKHITPNAYYLVHVWEVNGSCTAALVAPKRAEVQEGAEVTWDPRIDCTGMRIVSMDIGNFRPKTGECDHGQASGEPPVNDITDGPNGSKKTTVRKGASHGNRAAYCYDVTVNITGNAGNKSLRGDPEMDIVR